MIPTGRFGLDAGSGAAGVQAETGLEGREPAVIWRLVKRGRWRSTTSAPCCGPGTGDLGVSLHQDQQAVAEAVDVILAAGKEFGLPVAMNGAADVTRRIEQGARIFMGGATPEARREAGR